MSSQRNAVPPSPHLIIAAVKGDSLPKEPLYCDVCGKIIKGEPAGKGLLLWTRGDEVREELPVLCETCAPAIAAAGGMKWIEEEE